jgi:hypothetical protein
MFRAIAASVTRSAGVGGVMQPAPKRQATVETATSEQSLRMVPGYQQIGDRGK